MGFIKKDIISFNKKSMVNVSFIHPIGIYISLKNAQFHINPRNRNSHYIHIGWHKIIGICPFLINCIKNCIYFHKEKMFICEWKDCLRGFERAADFQAHVIKHGKKEQLLFEMQRMLGNISSIFSFSFYTRNVLLFICEWANCSCSFDKLPKLRLHIKIVHLGMRVPMSDDIWLDVLNFLERIQLAQRHSLTNRLLNELSRPRLHGRKVKAHSVKSMHIKARKDESGTWKAIVELPKKPVLRNGLYEDFYREVPIPTSPKPEYITEIRKIIIDYLDSQVMEFLSALRPSLTDEINIHYDNYLNGNFSRMLHYYQHQISLQLLFDTLIERSPKVFLSADSLADFCHYFPKEVDRVYMFGAVMPTSRDIPVIIKIIASSHPLGQQRIMILDLLSSDWALEMLDAIIEDFRQSKRPLPQPFYLRFFVCSNRVPPLNITEENSKTGEVMMVRDDFISPDPDSTRTFHITRYPKWQRDHWMADAEKKLMEIGNTQIQLRIQKFGQFPPTHVDA